MKINKFIFIISIVIAFIVGCSDTSNYSPTSPVINSEPNWIRLDPADGAILNKDFTVSKVIKGSAGGELKLNASYVTITNVKVEISASLYFPKNCFGGEKLITMSVDDEFMRAEFSPCMDFIADKYAILDIAFKGKDLSSINFSRLQFVYQSPNGTIEPVVYDKLLVDLKSGTLQILNAKIPHFSRYGFIN